MKFNSLLLFACYFTMSAVTYLDALIFKRPLDITERMSTQPFTLVVAPILIFIGIKLLMKQIDKTNGRI